MSRVIVVSGDHLDLVDERVCLRMEQHTPLIIHTITKIQKYRLVMSKSDESITLLFCFTLTLFGIFLIRYSRSVAANEGP
jgi:hypothetical protein